MTIRTKRTVRFFLFATVSAAFMAGTLVLGTLYVDSLIDLINALAPASAIILLMTVALSWLDKTFFGRESMWPSSGYGLLVLLCYVFFAFILWTINSIQIDKYEREINDPIRKKPYYEDIPVIVYETDGHGLGRYVEKNVKVQVVVNDEK